MIEDADPKVIEAAIERDRASLASALDELQDRVTVDGIVREALGLIRSNTAGYTRAIDEAVRANPLALALTGIGLAWLVFGARKSTSGEPRTEALLRWEDEGGPVVPAGDIDTEWSRASDSLRQRASETLRRIEADARAAATSVRGSVADGASQVRDFAAERAAVVADLTAGLRSSFRHGLQGLSDSAQDRIAAAREAAYAARVRAERAVKNTAGETGRMIEDHPMVAGAIALAVGAALASALPRTRTEDATFGPERDRLMREAARLLAEERDRASRVASKIGADLKATARETLDAVADTVSEQTARAGDRIKDRVTGATSVIEKA